MEVVVTTGAISCAKLQSNHHHQQTNIQFFTGRMPFLSPTQKRQSTEGKNITSHGLAYPKLTWGLPTLSLTTNSSWLPWWRFAMPLTSPLMPVPLVWWGSMHVISSYHGKRLTNTHTPTNKQTHRQDRLQYTAPQLASAQCNNKHMTITDRYSKQHTVKSWNVYHNEWGNNWTWKHHSRLYSDYIYDIIQHVMNSMQEKHAAAFTNNLSSKSHEANN